MKDRTQDWLQTPPLWDWYPIGDYVYPHTVWILVNEILIGSSLHDLSSNRIIAK